MSERKRPRSSQTKTLIALPTRKRWLTLKSWAPARFTSVITELGFVTTYGCGISSNSCQ